MKFAFKILAVLFLSISIAGQPIVATYAAANNNTETTVVSEYDLLRKILLQDTSNTGDTEISDEGINDLLEFDFINELDYRASLDREELAKMGYSDDKITKIKSFTKEDKLIMEQNKKDKKSKKEKLEELDEVVAFGIFANMSLTTSFRYYSTRYIGVNFNWEWSNMPVYYGGKDVVAFAWKGTNTAGQPIHCSIDTTNSFHQMTEYNQDGQTSLSSRYSLSVKDSYGAAQNTFQLGWRVEDIWGYYKKGTGAIVVDATGTDSIKEIGLNISYGHSYVAINPVVTIAPLSLAIKFGGLTSIMETMASDVARYSSTGIISR